MNKNYKRKYTWNNFKRKVMQMTDEEKREFLETVRTEYMRERTLMKRGMEAKNLPMYRRQIAYIKTLLHMPGYHYHPRV